MERSLFVPLSVFMVCVCTRVTCCAFLLAIERILVGDLGLRFVRSNLRAGSLGLNGSKQNNGRRDRDKDVCVKIITISNAYACVSKFRNVKSNIHSCCLYDHHSKLCLHSCLTERLFLVLCLGLLLSLRS